MEKTFKAMQCQKCRKYFRKNKNHKTHVKKHFIFVWFLVKDINIINNFYKIKKNKQWPVFSSNHSLDLIYLPMSLGPLKNNGFSR